MRKDKTPERRHIEKTVSVSDPDMWYGKDSITAEMFNLQLPKDKETVRILFKSCDDFMVYRDFHEWDLDGNWEWCKEWLWNNIPDTVCVEWLYRHGYVKF